MKSSKLYSYYDRAGTPPVVTDYIVAESNGVITRDGDYLVHTFKQGDVHINVLSNLGNHEWSVLICAGGGAGLTYPFTSLNTSNFFQFF